MTTLPPQRTPPPSSSRRGFATPFGPRRPPSPPPASGEPPPGAAPPPDDAPLTVDEATGDAGPPVAAETVAADLPPSGNDDGGVGDASSPDDQPPGEGRSSASAPPREVGPASSAVHRLRSPLVPEELALKDLALPEAVRAQVNELGSRLEHRRTVAHDLGLAEHLGVSGGLIALFIGSSESSKAIVAGLLARKKADGRAGLEVVDLADALLRLREAFGEEMRSVLAKAKGDDAVLYIDGAAGLLTAWSMANEAGGSTRAAAMVELWAELDGHDGVVILASDQRPSIDARALQRIHTIIEFPVADRDPELRFQLLKAMFPSEKLRPPEAELREVAMRFRLSEAGFRNVVLDAAARAVAEAGARQPVVSTHHLVKAIAREYQKLGKLVTPAEFGDRFYAWVENDGA